MSEWWSYRLGSFLLFSPRTYGNLVATYNADVWPLQPVLLVLGLAALWVALRAQAARQARTQAGTQAWSQTRWVWCLLGAAWCWVGWGFHSSRFSSIHWVAQYLAWGFAVQGLALLWLGGLRSGLRSGLHFAPRAPARTAVAAAIVSLALLGWPLLGLVLGRPWSQAESFGTMPDPTAIATIGFLLLAPQAPRWLMVLPLLMAALGLLTARALQLAAA